MGVSALASPPGAETQRERPRSRFRRIGSVLAAITSGHCVP
jgi:hypothetical protein